MRRRLDRELATTVAAKLAPETTAACTGRAPGGFAEAVIIAQVSPEWVDDGQAGRLGAAAPLLVVLLATTAIRMTVIAAATLVLLAILGAIGGRLGGAPAAPRALRVTVGGGLAMAVTALIGRPVGAVGL